MSVYGWPNRLVSVRGPYPKYDGQYSADMVQFRARFQRIGDLCTTPRTASLALPDAWYNGWVGRAANIVWLVLAAAALMLLGQTLGLYDMPILRDVRSMLPLGQMMQNTEPTPNPAPLTVGARQFAEPSSAPQTDVCVAGAARFVHGAARLKAIIGTQMGEPLECERVVDAVGDTEQKTTTGLAYYRARNNIVAFTDGFDHLALTPDGLVHWNGDELEPPAHAEVQP